MQIVDAIKNLTIAMKGSGSVEDISTDQIAEAIQYMADNWGRYFCWNGRRVIRAPCRYDLCTRRGEEIRSRHVSISGKCDCRRSCI